MSDGALTLEFIRGQQRLRVSSFEDERPTLRSYEIQEVSWVDVEKTANEILTLLQRAHRTTRYPADVFDGMKKCGQLLFDVLIPSQAKDKLAATSATFLTLHLEDTLVHLPWELLHDGQEFLCRRFAMGRLASTQQRPTARSIRTPATPFKVLIIADPRGDLAGSYREGLKIKAFLDKRRDVFHVDFKSQPVEMSFTKKNLRDYDIVHYAGHADYHAQNPCESGWLLTDGKLRAVDICTMGGHQPMPALVFANACRSGQTAEWRIKEGCNQDVFGLANAYLLSGVQHYVGTFWDIPDEPGSDFVEYFYGFLAQGKAVGVALREAREALIVDGQEQTLVWGSYVLYGDPSIKFGARMREGVPREEHIGWRRRLRGRTLPKKIERRSPIATGLIGAVFVASSIFAGYSFLPRLVSKSTPSLLQLIAKPGDRTISVSAIAAPLTMSMNVIAQRKEADGSYSELLVREGSVLRSGDHFQVQIETNRRSHVYVLIFDSRGEASELFPDPKVETSEVIEAGHKTLVPDKDLWFWLDRQTGTETIYTLASEQALPDIHGLLSKMDKVGHSEHARLLSETEQDIQINERGIGGIATSKTVSFRQDNADRLRRIKRVTEAVASTGAVVRAISFEHR